MVSTEPQKSKSLMTFALLLLALVVLILIVAFSGYNKPKPVVDNTNNNQQTNNTNQELKPTVPGWKVYENKKYGFKIDYPSNWKARGNAKDYYYPSNIVNLVSPDLLNPNDPQILDSDKEEIYYKINNFDDPSLDNYFMNNSDVSVYSYSSMKDVHGANSIKDLIENNNEIRVIGKITIGGLEATEMIWGGEGEEYAIITENNGYFYDIVFNRISGKEGLSETMKQIISSFQFIK